MASQTTQLIVELLDRVSGPARGVANSLRGISRSVRVASGDTITMSDRVNAAITRNDAAIEASRGKMLDAVGTLWALKAGLSAPVEAAQNLERSLAELGTKGNLTSEELRSAGDAARKTGADMNQFTSDVVRAQDFLVGMGLENGMATKAMPTIARAATATGASLEDLSKAGFASMSNLGVRAKDLGKSFDIMAAAGKAGGFELKDMAQYLPSITALAQSKGIKGQQGLSEIAAALQVVRRGAGDGAEAATNFSNILQKINSNDAIRNFERKGIDIQKVLKDAVDKGADPLEASLNAINKAIGGDTSRLGEIFADAQVQKGLLPLLTDTKDYISLRDKAAGANGVVDTDFARMMETSGEKMKATRIAADNLSTSFGVSLLPALDGIAAALTPVIGGLGSFVQNNPSVVAAVTLAAAGFAAFKAAINGMRFAGLIGQGGALSLLRIGVDGVGGALGRMGRNVGEMNRLQRTLAEMEGARYTTLDLIVNSATAIAFSAPGVNSFTAALSGLGSVLATLSSPVWGTFAVIAAAIGSAGLFIWKYWDRISSVMSGVGDAIGTLLQPALDRIRPVLDWFAPLGNTIAAGWDAAKASISAVSDWLGTVFQRETLSDADKERARQSGHDFVMALWNGMKQVFNDLAAWVGQQVDRLIAPLRGLKDRVTGFFAGGGDSGISGDPGGAAIPARAGGGPVSRGSTYLVGERGPELITAGRAGYVNRAGSGAAGTITISPVFNMTFNGRTEPDDVVEQVRRVLREEVRETFRGVFADTSMRFA